MKGNMLIYRPGISEPVLLTFTPPPTLTELNQGVGGGPIEIVPGFKAIYHDHKVHPCVALVDEHGKIAPYGNRAQPLPTNTWATLAWDWALRFDGSTGIAAPSGQVLDYLVGPVAVLFGDDEWMDKL